MGLMRPCATQLWKVETETPHRAAASRVASVCMAEKLISHSVPPWQVFPVGEPLRPARGRCLLASIAMRRNVASMVDVPQWTLGERLRKAMHWGGVDEARIARILGVTDRTVRNYLSDATRPKLVVLRQWADATRVPLDWLIGDDEEYLDLTKTDAEQVVRQSGWTAVAETADPREAAHEGPESLRAKELCGV